MTEHEPLTTGDWLRYAGLLGLGTLVFLFIHGSRDNTLLILVASYLVLAAVGLLVHSYRKGRS